MILLTGATGFVGSAVLARLERDGIAARAAVRRLGPLIFPDVPCVQVVGLGPDTHWEHALAGVQTVVHAAARVHVMREGLTDSLGEYRRVNVGGTLRLARQAATAGVRRFVFLSSVKVNGEATQRGAPFSADDPPAPCDPYGVSKNEAEQGLREIAAETGMEVVLIRPPLVYGPKVQANFLSMMRWLHRGVPLPLGAIHNRRSLVAIDNLVDLVATCLYHPAAANQTFLVSDGEDISTTQLLRTLGEALGRPARLIPVPAGWLQTGARMLGRQDTAQRLLGSLQVDISKARTLLGWEPPVSVAEGLQRTADDWLASSGPY